MWRRNDASAQLPFPTVLSLSKPVLSVVEGGRIASNRPGFLSDAARMAIAARLAGVVRDLP
jgi:hypothetical protein